MLNHEEIRQNFYNKICFHFDRGFIILIMEAYDYAAKAHKDVLRDDGSLYIEHCVAVALILLEECKINDFNFVISALLHDVLKVKKLEDKFFAEVKLPEITAKFGEINAYRVNIIARSKISDLRDSYYEILVHYGDVVSVFVKLADALHNTRTLANTDKDKQKNKINFIKKELPGLIVTLERKVLLGYPNNELLVDAIHYLSNKIIEAGAPYLQLMDNGEL